MQSKHTGIVQQLFKRQEAEIATPARDRYLLGDRCVRACPSQKLAVIFPPIPSALLPVIVVDFIAKYSLVTSFFPEAFCGLSVPDFMESSGYG